MDAFKLALVVFLLSCAYLVAATITATTSNVTTLTVGSPPAGFVLQEDGFFIMQQDGTSKISNE